MASLLALLSAVCFALAAALQQRGELLLARGGAPVEGFGSLVRLLRVPVWLLGTLVLLVGYVTQGNALDRGRLIVVQPLLVTTIVWALPLGRWLSGQQVVRRQVLGALVVAVGLAMFTLVGDPDAGRNNAPTADFVIAIVVVSAIALGLGLLSRRTARVALRAAALGAAAGVLFGLRATITKPVVEELHVSLSDVLGDWRTYCAIGFGLTAFAVQQLSLAAGQLAPAMAAVSVADPVVSVFLGIALFLERLTRPTWHAVVAALALLAALAGAVMITLASRHTEIPRAVGGDAGGDEPSGATPRVTPAPEP